MSDIYIDPTGKMPGSFRTLAEWEKWKDEKRSDPMSKHTREELIKHLRRSVSGMERAAADMLESDGELIAAWERAGLTPPPQTPAPTASTADAAPLPARSTSG